ncbi:class I SAM-dependent methyltransferase [Actinoplanes sp. NPDC051411]|uniref:class I SAM-dependent methyltransferase n=1 Tax=Actinoplanes sp. NPDC051411 TaxID=3155522 RepID=UPI00341C03D6
MIDYDREAAVYDGTRGGEARAAAVFEAVAPLLPPRGTLLDVACGTGIVSARFAGPQRTVIGVDRSIGMLSVAAGRLAGRAVSGDAAGLPVASGRVDAVLMVWLLHLLPSAGPALREAVRVLAPGPGSRVVTTVDKSAAWFAAPSDLASVTGPWRDGRYAADGFEVVASELGRHGLRPVGEATFPGVGQGRSPWGWREAVRAGQVSWARRDPEGVERALAALPDQDSARPEPIYRVVAFASPGG